MGNAGATSPPAGNQVDAWVDALDENIVRAPAAPNSTNQMQMMGYFAQQSLPRMSITEFDGKPSLWIEFITQIRDLVHNQPFLNDIQRSSLVVQHLKGEAKLAVQGNTMDWRGYVLSLKRLKFLFGQRSEIARHVLQTVTSGKPVGDNDFDALAQYYYTVCNCLTTLKQLDFASDLYSSDTLRQAVKRLPQRMVNKWAEYSLSLRQRSQDPNLLHFEVWLQARVLASKDACVVDVRERKQKKSGGKSESNGGHVLSTSGGDPPFWKDKAFKALEPAQKFQKVKDDKLCFNCLKDGHQSPKCSSKGSCLVKGCKKKHHTTLHDYFASVQPEQRQPLQPQPIPPAAVPAVTAPAAAAPAVAVPAVAAPAGGGAEAPAAVNGNCMMITGPKLVYLQVVAVILHANDKQTSTYALLDSASQFTMMRVHVAKALGLEAEEKAMSLETVKKEKVKVMVQKVSLKVSPLDRTCSFEIPEAFVVPANCFNMPSQPAPQISGDPKEHSYIDGLDLKGVDAKQIGILIGASVAEATLAKEVRRGKPGQPLAINTMLGWTLFGKDVSVTSAEDGPARIHCLHETLSTPELVHRVYATQQSADDRLDEAVDRFFAQEQSLISPAKETAMSQEDIQALDRLQSGTRLLNGRYEVPMLWRDPNLQLPNNYNQALKRFLYLLKRLRADNELYLKYKKGIEQLVVNGYARKLSPAESASLGPRTWRLPHHPVFNVNKPGKLRIVNDAAAEYNKQSLNKSLVTGPDLLKSLIGVLLRFRISAVAIAGDIEGMFHQVRVSDEDSDSLRFLWTDNIFSDDRPYEMKMLVHIFGAKDSMTCCCYALQRTARDNFSEMSAIAYETMLKAFYADDLLRSVQSEAVAKELIRELTDVCKRGGFRLTKFVSNSKAVLDSIPECEVSPKARLNLDGENLERVLGVKWDIPTDTFTFEFIPVDAPTTKRGILKVTVSLHDPLSFLAPFILTAKLLVQELWRLRCDWDDDINPDLAACWERWKAGARQVGCVQVPRQFNSSTDSITEIQLHVFGDASELAYGSVAYLRFSFKDGRHELSYVISKSKLAPLKVVTLPRLELNAAVTAVRLYRNIIHEIDLPIERICFWTDSTLTLQYIGNTKHRFKVYPANRVSEILESTQVNQWNLCPGVKNPADLLTRGIYDPSKLMEKDKNGRSWFGGLDDLTKDEIHWPEEDFGALSDDDPEIKRKSFLVALGFCCYALHGDGEQIDASRFSTWIKMKRCAGWMLRFVSNHLLHKGLSGDLSPEELYEAELFIIRGVQHGTYDEEIDLLRKEKNLSSGNVLSLLSPFLDAKECLRVGGRLRKAQLPTDAKHQLILPKNHPVTTLLITHEHTSNRHVGSEHVLSNLRQRFWVVNGRIAVKTVLRKCFLCRVRRARQMFPYMADLPTCRMAYLQPPFSNCGVDLFGPVYIKQGRKRLKRWVSLFTCLTIRCVHLEVVESPDTNDFINALRRFTNRRGCPEQMHSDCGGNFKGAAKELPEVIEKLNKETINKFATDKNIVWTFNPPSAPHMGGAWERMVRSVKEVMTATLHERVLTDPQLATLLTEVESIVNNRPLTHISDDSEDLEALTPNHILLGLHRKWEHVIDVDKGDVTSRKHWRQVQAISINFWERWLREYLPQLTTRGKGKLKLPNFKKDELVLLGNDDEFGKGKWSLARIVETMPGDDGIVRVVRVRTKDGEYTRPAVKVFRLEDNVEVPQGEGYVNSTFSPSISVTE